MKIQIEGGQVINGILAHIQPMVDSPNHPVVISPSLECVLGLENNN